MNDILDHLKNKHFSFDVLKNTGIVNTLRKTKRSTNDDIAKNEALQNNCSELLSKWKRDVQEEVAKISSKPSKSSGTKKSKEVPTTEEKKDSKESSSQVDSYLNPSNLDRTRSKFRTLLYNDFKDTVEAMGVSTLTLLKCIVDLEEGLHAKFNPPSGEISPDYRQHFRDIRFNLGKNRQLLGDLLYGEVSGARVAAMSTEEMMSDDLKKERATIQQEMFEAYQTDWYKTHMMDKISGGFKCRRCGSDKTQYMQKQTRSADEPMTVFFECMNCGKRWRE